MTLQLHHLFYLLLATAILLYLFLFFYNRHTLAYKFRNRNYNAFKYAVMENDDLTYAMKENRKQLFLKHRPSMLHLMLYGRPFIIPRFYSKDQQAYFFSRKANSTHGNIAPHVKSKYDFAVFDEPISMLASGKYIDGVLTPAEQ